MGNYVTTTALYPVLVGVEEDTATTALLGKCIGWAENEINASLARRYTVSNFLPNVPPVVTTLTDQIATGLFHIYNARGPKGMAQVGERMLVAPRATLLALAEGREGLVDSDGELVSPTTSPAVLSNTDEYAPIFGLDKPTSWKVDSDQLDEIRSERD